MDSRIVSLQIDIWSRGNPFIVAKKVDEVMKKSGYDYLDEKEINEENINRIMFMYKILE